MSLKPKKLGTDKNYVKPKVTFQEGLTNEEIQELLSGYVQVDNISEVPIDTHVRYFVNDKKNGSKFRMGGFLHNKKNADTYVVISNGKNKWTVQVKDTYFFKKMSHAEEIESIHKLYKKKIDKLEKKIKLLQKQQGSKSKSN